jgi:hypothetical protein
MIDPEGDEDWVLDCLLDLPPPVEPGAPPDTQPLIQLQRIGI